MDASILVLCANLHFTGVTVTFYRCFGSFTGFRDGQGENKKLQRIQETDPHLDRPGMQVFFVPNLVVCLCCGFPVVLMYFVLLIWKLLLPFALIVMNVYLILLAMNAYFICFACNACLLFTLILLCL